MIRKVLCFVGCLALCISMVACGNSGSNNQPASSTATAKKAESSAAASVASSAAASVSGPDAKLMADNACYMFQVGDKIFDFSKPLKFGELLDALGEKMNGEMRKDLTISPNLNNPSSNASFGAIEGTNNRRYRVSLSAAHAAKASDLDPEDMYVEDFSVEYPKFTLVSSYFGIQAHLEGEYLYKGLTVGLTRDEIEKILGTPVGTENYKTNKDVYDLSVYAMPDGTSGNIAVLYSKDDKKSVTVALWPANHYIKDLKIKFLNHIKPIIK